MTPDQQHEVKELLKKMYKKKYRDQEAWEKFLNDEARRERRRVQKNREVLFDPSWFEFKEV